jgi:hypothetical protein
LGGFADISIVKRNGNQAPGQALSKLCVLFFHLTSHMSSSPYTYLQYLTHSFYSPSLSLSKRYSYTHNAYNHRVFNFLRNYRYGKLFLLFFSMFFVFFTSPRYYLVHFFIISSNYFSTSPHAMTSFESLYYSLNDGRQMPKFGLGVYQSARGNHQLQSIQK